MSFNRHMKRNRLLKRRDRLRSVGWGGFILNKTRPSFYTELVANA